MKSDINGRTTGDISFDIEHIAESADPYPMHAELRERGAHCLDDGRWIVARAADVELVLGAEAAGIGFVATDPAGAVQERMARFSDGPAHERRRAAAVTAIAAFDVEQLRRRAGELTQARHGALGPARCEIMSSVARHVPLAVLAEALGLASEPAVSAATDLVGAIAPRRGCGRGDAETPMRQLAALFTGAGNEFDDETLNRASLLFQTLDATAGLIGNCVLATRRSGPPKHGVAAFVGEVSRFDPSVQFTTRVVRSSIEVGSRHIPAGDTVIVDLAAANRDPQRWNDPDTFDPGRARRTTGPMAYEFGWGTHGCPGNAIAIALATGVVEGLIATGGKCAGEPVAYETSFNLRIPKHVEWIATCNGSADAAYR